MELIINNNSYHIPNTWSQVSLGKYMKFAELIDGVEDEYQQTLITLSCFIDVPIQLLESCKKSDIDNVMLELSKLIQTPANKELNLIITIDGVDYGFHPNLHELKLKEFVDLDNKLDGGWKNMHSVMSILYRPVISSKGDKYDIEDYDFVTASKRAELFKDNLSVNTVNGASSFFLTIGMDYINTTQVYLKNLSRKQRRKILRQRKNNLKKDMVGTV